MNKSKKIYQYDLEYNFIKEWNSLSEIIENNKNYKKGSIRDTIYGKSKSTYKYRWSYSPTLTKPVINIKLIIDKKYFLDQDVYDYPDDKEYWKDIIGYETKYKISNHGNVFTYQKNKIMSRGNKDYMAVKLYDINMKTKMHYVHVLVAKHFIKNPKNLPKVNHIDENKHNPHYKNLEWNTSSQNTQSWHDNKPVLKVLQYDLDNKLIKEWNSIKEILETHENYRRRSIVSCVNGSVTKRYGYIWKYKNPPIKKIRNKIIIKDEPSE